MRLPILTSIFLFLCCLASSAQPSELRDTLTPAVKTDIRRASLSIGEIETDLPGLRGILSPLGEGDPIKWAQSLPGVTTGADGSSSYFVRGGNMGNNLITLDGVPVYGYSHLLGLTTILPQDIMQSANLQKGGFDGGEGNFTSSHLRVTTRRPSSDRFRMSASLNNFLASVSVDTPLSKNTSLLLSGRVSPLALEYRAFRGLLPDLLGGFDDFGAGVGDLYGKFRWYIDARSSLDVSFLGSMDSYSFIAPGGDHERMGWDNAIGMARYSREDGPVTTDATVSLNHYGSRQVQGKDFRGEWQELSLESDLLEAVASAGRINSVNDRMSAGYGLNMRYARFMPGQVASKKKETHTLLFNAYGQASYVIPEHLAVSIGTRLHYWQNITTGNGRFDPDVSVSVKWDILPSLALEGTFDRMVQYYHTLEGLPVGWSLDMIVPSDTTAVPESSLQGSLGLSSEIGRHSFSAGAFYKKMDNLVYYRYAQTLFNGALSAWEDNVDIGQGLSYGAEFMYEYKGEDLYARGSYTLSKTNRFGFPNICEGKEFHARFDRRHVLNAMAQWRGFSAAVTLQSGHWENGASETYKMHHLNKEEWILHYFGKVNNYHMPTVFRLDLGYNFSFKTGKVAHDVNVGVCNVTNHFNPFMLYYDASTENFKMISLLPILPNFSYRISF